MLTQLYVTQMLKVIYFRFKKLKMQILLKLIVKCWAWMIEKVQWAMNEKSEKVRETETKREKGEKPWAAPHLVILTQIQHWNMATMWTLSESLDLLSV